MQLNTRLLLINIPFDRDEILSIFIGNDCDGRENSYIDREIEELSKKSWRILDKDDTSWIVPVGFVYRTWVEIREE